MSITDRDRAEAGLGIPGPATNSVADALTALAGGAQAGTALNAYVNRFTTVATIADSAQLPAALPGRSVVVVNAAAANSMNVFPKTGEYIDAGAVNAAVAVAAAKTRVFFCAVIGTWNSVLGA